MVDVVVAGVAVGVVGYPAIMDAPGGVVEVAPAPPIPVVEAAIPVVVGVVTNPVAVVAVWPVVVRCPPVDMGPLKDTPMARHMVDGVGVVVPMRVASVSVERGVPNEVVHAILFVDGVLREVHWVVVGME